MEKAAGNIKIVIEAGRAERQYWHDLWRYRELFYFLAWRDILVRYKQTVVGILWSLLRPFVTMVVFTIVFNKIAGIEVGGVPYPILVFTGMLPWQFFSTALSEAGNSLVTNSNLISKVYFPRLVVPASTVITCLVDFFISAAFLVVLMVWYQFLPSWRIVTLPFFLMLSLAASMGAGLWLSAMMVKYRDFRFIVPFIVQFGVYISPVAFPSEQVLKKFGSLWFRVYSINPMVGVIDGFRWAIVGGIEFSVESLVISVATVALLLFSGIWYFRKTERSFADVI